MKRIFKIIFIIQILLIPFISNALIISEIMYDPEGSDTKREWVEIYNDSESNIDISKIKLRENNVNHSISVFQGPNILESKKWAIIADNPEYFLIDYPSYTGQLFDCAFSLSNTGETLDLIDSAGIVLDSLAYTGDLGAKDNGFSLQLAGEILIPAGSTIGEENKKESEELEESEDEEDGDLDISSHSEQEALTSLSKKEILKIGAGRERAVLINSPFTFEAIFDKGNSNQPKFHWYFGDGHFRSGKNVSHLYKREGIYNVILHGKNSNQYAVSRTKVFAYEPKLIFSATTTVTGSFEIKAQNNSKNEANIGGFEIDFGQNDEYIFPPDTIIEPNSSIIFDEELFRLEKKDSSILKVFYPNGNQYSIIDLVFPQIENSP